jgi:biliverdin reductase
MSTKAIAPLKVGIVGTGYAAKKRAEALISDKRTKLLVVTGNTPERLQEFSRAYEVETVDSWTRLVNLPELDLIFVCTINRDSGAIARAAILAGKHVVVEYPLALEAKEAAEIVELARTHQKLLHVEHMEIIGGLHQAIKQHLPQIGRVFYARYATISFQQSVRSWKYHRAMFGFPLAAALSRIHRLTDLFGDVDTISCQNRYWDVPNSDYFTACLCNAQLKFNNGIIAEVTYGKGDVFWHSQRTLEIYGDTGTMVFQGEKGTLIKQENKTEIPVTPRRGLFAQDTAMVLDYLFNQQPLYVTPQASIYALQVANAAHQSACSGQTIQIK